MTFPMRTYWIVAQTPVHVGAGAGNGAVDLPVARERVTQWPVVPGSSLRGVLRAHFTAHPPEAPDRWVERAFGDRPEGGGGRGPAPGALAVADGHLVLLPTPSLYGTFAYATCPLALSRLTKDVAHSGYTTPDLPAPPEVGEALVASGSDLCDEQGLAYLEDYDHVVREDPTAEAWAEWLADRLAPDDEAWRRVVRARLAIVADDVFSALARRGTEVVARIRVGSDGRVEPQALWYEESVPVETVFAGVVWCDVLTAGGRKEADALLSALPEGMLYLQLGGHAGVGRGIVAFRTEGGSQA